MISFKGFEQALEDALKSEWRLGFEMLGHDAITKVVEDVLAGISIQKGP